jgi:hypothetical protein
VVAFGRLVVAADRVVAGKPDRATDTGGLRSSRASLTRRGRKSNGVHKNDTSCKPIIDTLAARVRFFRAFRIDRRIELFAPPASLDAKPYSSPTAIKEK